MNRNFVFLVLGEIINATESRFFGAKNLALGCCHQAPRPAFAIPDGAAQAANASPLACSSHASDAVHPGTEAAVLSLTFRAFDE